MCFDYFLNWLIIMGDLGNRCLSHWLYIRKSLYTVPFQCRHSFWGDVSMEPRSFWNWVNFVDFGNEGFAYMHTYMYMYIVHDVHTYMHIYIHVHVHTYIHKLYIHTYIHTYMYIYTYMLEHVQGLLYSKGTSASFQVSKPIKLIITCNATVHRKRKKVKTNSSQPITLYTPCACAWGIKKDRKKTYTSTS